MQLYDIKELINKMRDISNANSNVKLANILNVSYNTLNTWIKRAKLPQDVLIEFANKYNCSLDYLILNKQEQNTLTNNKTTLFNNAEPQENKKIRYYGSFPALNISNGATLTLNKDSLHSNAYYLLKKDNIFFIAKVNFNVFSKQATVILSDYIKELTLEEFNLLNQGLIVSTN